MIPEEAVEAAARGMFAEEQCDRRQKLDVESNWQGRLDDRDRDEYRRLSRAALAAAAPHLRLAPVLCGECKGSGLADPEEEDMDTVCPACGGTGLEGNRG